MESPRKQRATAVGAAPGPRASRSPPAAPPPGPSCCLGGRRPGGLGLGARATPRSAPRAPPCGRPARPRRPRSRRPGISALRPGPGADRCGRRRAAGRAGCCRARWAAGSAPARSAASGPGRSSGAAPSPASAACWRCSAGHGSGPRRAGPGERPGGGGRGAARAEARPRLRARPLGRAAWSTRAPGHPWQPPERPEGHRKRPNGRGRG